MLSATVPGGPDSGFELSTGAGGQPGRLFVAGAAGGNGRVVDTRSGKVLASYTFATAPTFVNDVILTKDAAWFTDSRKPVLYKVPLGRHGKLPAQSAVQTIAYSGDYQHVPDVNNANGIALTPDGRALIIVQSATGFLFRVDPRTGARGQLVDQITSPDFDVPTTAAAFGSRLYLPNARFNCGQTLNRSRLRLVVLC